MIFVPLRVQAGDDASCLNLYQPRQPRIVGVPRKLIEEGGFSWGPQEGKGSGWRLLLQPREDGAIPAVGEANTVKWMLKSGLGQEITIRDGSGQTVRLRIVALLQDSVFQGELLIGEDNFLKLFPRQEGFQLFLIDAPPGEKGERIRRQVENALADYGFSMTPAGQRLQSYLDVENTYLATFQALGGLGLLLGTLGLAVVLVRSVDERRGELALLRAPRFPPVHAWLAGVGRECLASFAGPGFWLLGGRHCHRSLCRQPGWRHAAAEGVGFARPGNRCWFGRRRSCDAGDAQNVTVAGAAPRVSHPRFFLGERL